MQNLNLKFNDEIIHSIPRKDIGVELDFDSLTSQLQDCILQQKWMVSMVLDGTVVTDIYFKEKYMAECAYQLWGYLLKQEIKKIS